MKARETQRKTTATGGSRKLKVSKKTLQDLTPSARPMDVKGGWSSVGGGRSNANSYSFSKGA